MARRSCSPRRNQSICRWRTFKEEKKAFLWSLSLGLRTTTDENDSSSSVKINLLQKRSRWMATRKINFITSSRCPAKIFTKEAFFSSSLKSICLRQSTIQPVLSEGFPAWIDLKRNQISVKLNIYAFLFRGKKLGLKNRSSPRFEAYICLSNIVPIPLIVLSRK